MEKTKAFLDAVGDLMKRVCMLIVELLGYVAFILLAVKHLLDYWETVL